MAQGFGQELHDIMEANARRMHERGRIVRLQSGEETLEAIQVHTVQWYYHTIGFVNALRHLYDRCEYVELRPELAESLFEEETGRITQTKAHLDLYFQMAESFDITREALEARSYCLPEVGALINWYHYAATALSTVEGLAVLAIGAEGNNARVGEFEGSVKLTADALRTQYGKSDHDVEFYDVHAYADQDHADVGVRNVLRYATTPEMQERVRTCLAITQDHFAGIGNLKNRSLNECWKRPSAVLYQ